MQYSEWEPIYEEIVEDMGYSREEDENSVRVLKAVTMNLQLEDERVLSELIGHEATVFGNAAGLEEDIGRNSPIGTFIASGSAVNRLSRMNIRPDIVVTDLDGDILAQLRASEEGAVTMLHAHGDNPAAILLYAPRFNGPVILTTQSQPETTVFNFGGFTDGDRAVCLARHFGAKRIQLAGFDFDNPVRKDGSDPEVKLKKLGWAKRIIHELNPEDVSIIGP